MKINALLKISRKEQEKRAYYVHVSLLNDYPTLRTLANRMERNFNVSSTTRRLIQPYGLDLMKSGMREAQKLLKENQYAYRKQYFGTDLSTIFTRYKQSDFKVKSQLHYHKGVLCLIKTEISKSFTNSNLEYFWQSLLVKYDLESNQSNSCFVRDKLGSMIYMENNTFNLVLYYTQINHPLIKELIQRLNPEENHYQLDTKQLEFAV